MLILANVIIAHIAENAQQVAQGGPASVQIYTKSVLWIPFPRAVAQRGPASVQTPSDQGGL